MIGPGAENVLESGSSTSVTAIVTSLMSGCQDDRDMWRLRAADIWERASEADDLELLRNALIADERLADFYDTLGGDFWFGLASLAPYSKGECYDFAIALAKMDREYRRSIFKEIASVLRQPNLRIDVPG